MEGGEDLEKVAELDQRYDEIITTAKTEYEYEPPGKYFKDGYNLYKRMAEEKERYTLSFYMIQGWNRITTWQKDVQENSNGKRPR